MQSCWQKPQEPFIVGKHTAAICERIDQAFARFDRGESTFLVVKVPFRHGKSDLLSRYLPPHFLGRFPDKEVLLCTYAADLSEGFSRFARSLMRAPEYQALYPEIEVSAESSAVHHWELAPPRMGAMHAAGLGNATGRGYALGLLDDYHRNRQDAESAVIRDRNWESFTNDFLTRRAPVSVTVVLATPWHVDDIIGRLTKAMAEDPDFPRFEVLTFPAMGEQYASGYLFPERFPESWYKAQAAALGAYGTASLLQCDPVQHGGTILRTDKVKIVEPSAVPASLRWGRGWDLASTEEQLAKNDPDYTVGLRMAVETLPMPEGVVLAQAPQRIWIADVVRMREAAPTRDRRIVQIAQMDGPGVQVGTESVAGYKDTATRLAEILKGVAIVTPVKPPGDLMLRVSPLEPVFEAGNVCLVRGEWNREFLEELERYPSAAHDDQVAALVTAWELLAHVVYWSVLR
jgi:predicted phage terminase large subunit-like protein